MLSFTVTSTQAKSSGWEALGFTSASMLLQGSGGTLRYSYSEGQEPSSSSGHRLFAESPLLFSDAYDIKNFSMIAESADVLVTITHKA